jgi:o-succinylbenzoate synthase
MNLDCSFEKIVLNFKQPAGTSRGVLNQKISWILSVWDRNNPTVIGQGECSVIPGLSPDYTSDDEYELMLSNFCNLLRNRKFDLTLLDEQPSIQFGFEMALLDLRNGGQQKWFDNSFSRGEKALPINGLIWMGDEKFMRVQIEKKLDDGFTCLKMKVGAIDFDKEIEILSSIRERFSKDVITLRVDANGAFSPSDALKKLERLAELDIHSIEQPIKQGHLSEMKELCNKSPLPIALDEELIGVSDFEERKKLLEYIRPQYIILKPSLVGGFNACREWIDLAESLQIGWWITSALESNLGLNAIAQFTGNYEVDLPQGLGTGGLYTTNLPAPLYIENGYLQLKSLSLF